VKEAMSRRFVSLLLLPGLLLAQSATFGRAHVGNGTSNHAAHPHVHLHGGHGHSHAPDGSHYDEDEDQPSSRDIRPTADHDGDAVYLLIDAECPKPNRADDGHTRAQVRVISSVIALPVRPCLQPDRCTGWAQPPPASASADCPRYLRHLTLLL
jgi:hypothetical protein